jgi:hypothetical protein
MANVRTFYACQKVSFGTASGSADVSPTEGYKTLNGIQSVGITTNFNLDPVYQLGRIAPGDLFEDVPDVEISVTKQLDGTLTIYEQMMGATDAAGKTLAEVSDNRSAVLLQIYPQAFSSATGEAIAVCKMLPAYLSSVTYNFPADGAFTEEVSIVSNSKQWAANTPANTDPPDASLTGIARRQMFDLANSVFPTGAAGTNGGAFVSGSLPADFKLQSVSVSVDLGREEIFELGKRLPFTRYINFPVEVNTEFEVISASGDFVGATETEEVCSNPKALAFKTIKIATCDGMVLDLGDKNKLQSVSAAGGDAGGDNVTYTYSYINYSKFKFTCPTGGDADPDNVGGFEQVDLSGDHALQDYNK